MIVDATLGAIKRAAIDYTSFSGGASPWSAPEYYYTTCIVQKIASLKWPPSVTLEYGVAAAIEAAGGQVEGIGPNERFDIVLWGDESPIAVIEVKLSYSADQNTLADVERICNTLNNNDDDDYTIKYGMLALLIPDPSTDSDGQITTGHLETRIPNLRIAVLNHVNHYGEGQLRVTSHVRRIPPDDYGREYAAMVHRISRLPLA